VHQQPLRQNIHNPLLQAFMESITRVTGHQSQPCLSQGLSDAPYFNKVGIPCALTYLPGGGHHGESEWISREALALFPLVIADYIEHNALIKPPARHTS
jgi:acetylornithine deacetylase/succinyl-diaminopimelate desuccinylase-like protein